MAGERPEDVDIWAPAQSYTPGLDFWRVTVALVGAVSLVRVIVLFLSRLELYPDEAQYWLWSRHLAFGYFSKPPMVAWLIRATTALGGDREAWVRLSAPLLHGAAALALARAAHTAFNARIGLLTAALYVLAPGILLSSAVIATDAPLLLFVSLGLWSYVTAFVNGREAGAHRPFIGLGLAIGAGVLTKYAALYLVAGLLAHAGVSARARSVWTVQRVLLVTGIAVAMAAPNLIWNAQHHFQTVAHTADNADIGGERGGRDGLISARGPVGFILGQFGVYGPIPFAAFCLAVLTAFRRRTDGIEVLLVSLAAPAFIIVSGESVLARANANWAAAGYPAGFILAAAVMDRARTWRRLAIGSQSLFSLAFTIAIVSPGLIDATGAASAVKRARGWSASASAVATVAREQDVTAPITAVVVDDRFLFNALAYYGRGPHGEPAGALPAPLRMWVHLAKPMSQAEAEAPMDPVYGARALGVSTAYLDDFRADFAATQPLGHVRVALGGRNSRRLDLFTGEGFRPRPREPSSGRPTRP